MRSEERMTMCQTKSWKTKAWCLLISFETPAPRPECESKLGIFCNASCLSFFWKTQSSLCHWLICSVKTNKLDFKWKHIFQNLNILSQPASGPGVNKWITLCGIWWVWTSVSPSMRKKTCTVDKRWFSKRYKTITLHNPVFTKRFRYLKWSYVRNTYISCMDTAYVREKKHPLNKVQETIHFRYQKTCWCLVLVVEQFKGMTEFRVEIT